MAAGPQGTQSGWDRGMGTLEVVLNGAAPEAKSPAWCHLPAAPVAPCHPQGWHRAGTGRRGQGVAQNRYLITHVGLLLQKEEMRSQPPLPPQDDQALEEPKKISWAALKMLALRGKFQKFKGDKPPALTFLWIFSILADKALGEPGEHLQHHVLVWSQ